MNIIDTLDYSCREVTYEENRQNIDEELTIDDIENDYRFSDFEIGDETLSDRGLEQFDKKCLE